MSRDVRISLSCVDFRDLVWGKTVTRNLKNGKKLEIALQDIGFVAMLQEIGKAEDDYYQRVKGDPR